MAPRRQVSSIKFSNKHKEWERKTATLGMTESNFVLVMQVVERKSNYLITFIFRMVDHATACNGCGKPLGKIRIGWGESRVDAMTRAYQMHFFAMILLNNRPLKI